MKTSSASYSNAVVKSKVQWQVRKPLASHTSLNKYGKVVSANSYSRRETLFQTMFFQTFPAIRVFTVTLFMEAWSNFILYLIKLIENSAKTVIINIIDVHRYKLRSSDKWFSLWGFALLNRYFLKRLTQHGGLK